MRNQWFGNFVSNANPSDLASKVNYFPQKRDDRVRGPSPQNNTEGATKTTCE